MGICQGPFPHDMHATKKTHVDSRLVRFRSRIFVAMNKLSGNSVRDESKNDSIAARSRLSGNCIVIVEQIEHMGIQTAH